MRFLPLPPPALWAGLSSDRLDSHLTSDFQTEIEGLSMRKLLFPNIPDNWGN